MIDAGEPEENIATVIQSFKTKPQVESKPITSEPIVNTALRPVIPEAAPEFTGSPRFTPPSESAQLDTQPSTQHEPKGWKDFLFNTSGIMPALESAAHPQTLGDIMSLILPSELPKIAKGNLSKIAESVAGKEPQVMPEIAPAVKAESTIAPEVSTAANKTEFNPASVGFGEKPLI